MAKIKVFEMQEQNPLTGENETIGAGGYVIGNGALPEGFDPDKFMMQFGLNITRRCMEGDTEALALIETKLKEAVDNAPLIKGRTAALLKQAVDPRFN